MVKRMAGPAGIVMVAALLAGCSGSGAGSSNGATASSGNGAPASVAAGGGGGGGATGGPVAAGGDLCKLLGPGDVAGVGITDASGPTENPTDPLNNYCVYRGKSSATGGIEFDVSVSESVADAQAVFPSMFGEGEFTASDISNVQLAGADEARLGLPNAASSTDPAIIAVRKGKLVFNIGMGVPFADVRHAGDQLTQLAALVLQRGAALGN
jgi:hypothetical protein